MRILLATTPGAPGHKREGDKPMVFHDLRHTFGTLCAFSGVPVGQTQHYMVHASPSTTEIYMHGGPATSKMPPSPCKMASGA